MPAPDNFAPRNFELGLLPEHHISWRTLATSYGLEVFLLLVLIAGGIFAPQTMELTRRYNVTELIARPDLRPEAQAVLKSQPIPVAKLLPPVPLRPHEFIVPPELRPQHIRPREEVKPPQLEARSFPAPTLKQVSGARPAKFVYLGAFGSSVTPTANSPVQKVQTGGFGDPNGVKGQGKENARQQIATLGSFDLPAAPGSGNGIGGAKGQKGTVASAGFGDGIAQPGQGDGRASARGTPQTGGFASQTVAPAVVRTHPNDNAPVATSVDITYKPNPVYTEEAKALQLQGEVLLEVMFGADGRAHVNRVVRGLGHGLDEAAVAAAAKMQFKPAQRNGTAVDSTVIVHVIFQLAS
ncbi:MAG: TonB family protein [Acidobacteriales bacterium]|nr:TonB family protein [Terriglobales bacterium]